MSISSVALEQSGKLSSVAECLVKNQSSLFLSSVYFVLVLLILLHCFCVMMLHTMLVLSINLFLCLSMIFREVIVNWIDRKVRPKEH